MARKKRTTELGEELQCAKCEEFWPADGEFFYGHKGKFHSWCKACYLASAKPPSSLGSDQPRGSRTERLRELLATGGPQRAADLAKALGVRSDRVGALLKNDIRKQQVRFEDGQYSLVVAG